MPHWPCRVTQEQATFLWDYYCYYDTPVNDWPLRGCATDDSVCIKKRSDVKKKKKVHVSIIICLQWWKFLTAAIVVCCIYCLTSLTSGCFSVWWPVVLTVWEGSWGNASRVFCDMKNARSPFVFSYAGKKCLLCSCSLFGACCSTTSSLIPDFFLEIKLKINSQKTFWCS